jgi:hypothetical protein
MPAIIQNFEVVPQEGPDASSRSTRPSQPSSKPRPRLSGPDLSRAEAHLRQRALRVRAH